MKSDPTDPGGSDPYNADTNPNGVMSLFDAVSGLYRTALGRNPENDQVVNQWIQGDSGDLAKIQQDIYASPEAKAFQAANMAKNNPTTGGTSGGNGGGGGGGTPPPTGGGNGVPNPTDSTYSYPGSGTGSASAFQDQLNAYMQSLISQQQWQMQQAQQQYADQQKFRQGILTNVNNIISQNSGIPTADDPTISPQVAAFKGQGEQALRQAREAYAERASAQGLPTGTLDSAVQQDYENLGKNTGAFSAGLVGQSLQQRQANLLAASQIGAGVLSGDQAAQLATTQNSIGAALANNQSQNTNALNWATLFQKPGLLAQSLGPAYLGINNQNNQFYDQFGYNMSQNDSGSYQALLHLLGLG